ncbi:GDP-L-fucose synthase [uncultured archaeon]|nr:GDP-L-fucose synthase [uncultured archaeon]
MNWLGKKILITGGSGFIGTALTKKLLSLGADITLFLENGERAENVKIIFGDLTKEIPPLKNFDYIFHTAAIVGGKKCEENKEKAFEVNVNGTKNLIDAIDSPNLEKLIYLSTSYVYGNMANASETDSVSENDLYNKTKILGEIVTEYHKKQNPRAIVRMSNVYGPEQKFGIIPLFIKKIKNGEEVLISDSTRDFIYIDDAIDGILSIAKYGKGIYNVGSGQETTIEKVVNILGEEIGETPVVRKEDNDEMKRNYLSIKKIKKLGWKPKYSLEEGLKETVRWMK